MHKVEAVPVPIDSKNGYDIRIHDKEATVQDYIDSLNRFIENNGCYRSRNPELNSCFACDLCCQERIPVTLVDAIKLSGEPLGAIIEKELHVYIEGQVVDITLALNESGMCHRLEREKRICRKYTGRPLVCQTFICCPSTSEARQLREEIVNAGEDELVRSWFKLRDKNGEMIIHEGINPNPDIKDYPKTAFYGRTSYNQIKIKDICSSGLWRKLFV